MEYRTLGTTGVRVSTHCLGAMMFGAWGNTDVDDCVRIVHEALDAGINFVDTADVYSSGESEEIVGRALRGRRDGIVLASKVHGEMGLGQNDRGNSRLWIITEVENSLRRLGTDHIDLYQIHRPEGETDVEETLGALTDLQRQGKIRYFGSSTFPGSLVVEAQWTAERRGLSRFRTEQPPYSIFVRHIEEDLLPITQRYGMGVLVWSPLCRGWLTGRYRREGFDESPQARATRTKERAEPIAKQFDLSRPENQHKLDLVEGLAKVAAEAGISMTHMAIAFTLAHPAVTSAIIGPRTPEQLRDLLSGTDVRLDEGTLDAIDALVAPGTDVDRNDRGFEPWWLEPRARRRSP
ncbi:MAG TPA: aldo/keto reductase [Actinomycetota bacterium]|jgi:aryl-alcohol dehydrogenase-like predicted oxidoreductase|nr:aldo/keto reductase [Actinomycetota bacterium]